MTYISCDRTGLYDIANTPNLSNLLNTNLLNDGTATEDTKLIYAVVEESGNRVLVITDGDTQFNAYTTDIAANVDNIHVTESGNIFIVDSNKDILMPATPGDYSTWINSGYATHSGMAPVVGMASHNDVLYVTDGNNTTSKIYKYDTSWSDVASHATNGINNYDIMYSETDNKFYILSSNAGLSPYVLEMSNDVVTDVLGIPAFGGQDLSVDFPTYINKVGGNFYIGDNDDILSGAHGGSFTGAARVTYDFDTGFPADPGNDVMEEYLVTSDNHIFVTYKPFSPNSYKLYHSNGRGAFVEVTTISGAGNPDMIHTKMLPGGNGRIFIGVTEDVQDTTVLGLFVYDYINDIYSEVSGFDPYSQFYAFDVR